MQLQGPKKPLHVFAHHDRLNKSEPMQLHEKHTANMRELLHGQSRKSAKHPTTCEKHGGMRRTVRGVRKLQNKKKSVSCKVIHDRESSYKKECAYVQLFLRIKNLKRSN